MEVTPLPPNPPLRHPPYPSLTLPCTHSRPASGSPGLQCCASSSWQLARLYQLVRRALGLLTRSAGAYTRGTANPVASEPCTVLRALPLSPSVASLRARGYCDVHRATHAVSERSPTPHSRQCIIIPGLSPTSRTAGRYIWLRAAAGPHAAGLRAVPAPRQHVVPGPPRSGAQRRSPPGTRGLRTAGGCRVNGPRHPPACHVVSVHCGDGPRPNNNAALLHRRAQSMRHTPCDASMLSGAGVLELCSGADPSDAATDVHDDRAQHQLPQRRRRRPPVAGRPGAEFRRPIHGCVTLCRTGGVRTWCSVLCQPLSSSMTLPGTA